MSKPFEFNTYLIEWRAGPGDYRTVGRYEALTAKDALRQARAEDTHSYGGRHDAAARAYRKTFRARLIERYKRKNPSKAQKRVKAQKASVQRRVAVALAKFLHQANPAMKTAGAKVTKLKGGGFTIRPIKAVKRGRR